MDAKYNSLMSKTPATAINWVYPSIIGGYLSAAAFLELYVISIIAVTFALFSFPTMLSYLSARAKKIYGI